MFNETLNHNMDRYLIRFLAALQNSSYWMAELSCSVAVEKLDNSYSNKCKITIKPLSYLNNTTLAFFTKSFFFTVYKCLIRRAYTGDKVYLIREVTYLLLDHSAVRVIQKLYLTCARLLLGHCVVLGYFNCVEGMVFKITVPPTCPVST